MKVLVGNQRVSVKFSSWRIVQADQMITVNSCQRCRIKQTIFFQWFV